MEPFDVLDYFVNGDHYLIKEFETRDASDFKQLRPTYFIDGNRPPFSFRLATEEERRTLYGEQYTFVEDWLHIPTNTIIHIAFQRKNYGGEMIWGYPSVFFGTHQHFVFALDRSDGDNIVIPAPKEQWDSVTDRNADQWWGRGLFTDEYTDFFMYGLYGLPMHYELRSRNDYESRRNLSREAIITELTGLGYQHVGDIVWSKEKRTEVFETV